ncbi:hypothetical protein DMP23_21105 [Amycolatopsis sp. A1MSW2902]|uniref:hypothetical protein n=1 Tax=Amycolatopsis sp. A1MSW2902 TaxID=687413 RepID=UPI00307CE8D0
MARLRAAAPAAESVAEVVGDPCYDRILASVHDRAHYRDAFRTGNRTLVYVSSTWFRNALLGSWPDLLRRLMAELPVDSYQVALALHPNIWHGHGPWQVRSWLADCVRAGMIILPEIDGWRTGLIAADIVIGDHGSVTGYGAALGRPTLLATFADEDIDPRSPLADLAESATRLDRARRLRPQIETALREHDPRRLERLRASITSVPGQALDRLRTVFYRLLDLDPPPGEPPLAPLPAWAPAKAAPLALQVSSTVDRRTRSIRLTRRPAVDLWDPEPATEGTPHLLCPVDHPQRTLPTEAAVVTTESSDDAHPANGWTRATLRRHPGAVIAAILSRHAAIAEFRDGSVWHASAPGAPADALPSVLCAWHLAGLPLTELEDACTVQLGETTYDVAVRLSTP